jgi:DNA polymerase-1
MLAYVFDIEGNGLREIIIDRKGELHPELTTVHLLVLRNYHTNEVKVYRGDEIAAGWEELKAADLVIGHNIFQYDLPVLGRFYGGRVQGKVFDTLVAARLRWPDSKHHPFGGNSVESFAKILGEKKVGKEIQDWSQWTQEMEDRCINDTLVQKKIFDYLKPRLKGWEIPLRLEMRLAEIVMQDMQEHGVGINIEGCEELIEQMELLKAQCSDELQEVFPPRIETMKTPAYYSDPDTGTQYLTKSKAPGRIRKHLLPGPLKTKEHPFNPGSSSQMAERLKERYDWDAPLTEAGNPTVTEDTLMALEYPEARLLVKYNMADTRLQHLTDWVQRARNSRTPGVIHPQINSCGAATSRATHQQPNQTACPKVVVDKEGNIKTGFEGRFGWECRSLWRPATEGYLMVGGDASGLELRCLGNRVARYDGGDYADIVVNGDVHTANMEAGGLDTRDQAKTTIYAFLYGAGDEKIGTTIADHPSLSDEQRVKHRGKSRKKIGRDLRARFEKNIKGLGVLANWCKQSTAEKGYLPLIDGRRAPIRSAHSALNTLLQGDGAIITKLAIIITHHKLNNLIREGLCHMMLWPHDEMQWEAHPDHAETVGTAIVEGIREAGERLKMACPLDGEYKIGSSWAETH